MKSKYTSMSCGIPLNRLKRLCSILLSCVTILFELSANACYGQFLQIRGSYLSY